MTQNILITITGPSLTGKTSFAKLLEKYNFTELVSTTSRKPRKGEVDGESYHFVTVEEFKKMEKKNKLIEATPVGENFYGISKKALHDVLDEGKNACLVIEPEGVKKVTEYCKSKNIPIYRIFLNNDKLLLIERFLERFKYDSLANTKSYAIRLNDILMEEPKKWVEPALNGQDKYEKIYDSFTHDNQEEVVSIAMKEVQIFLENLAEPENKKQIRMPF